MQPVQVTGKPLRHLTITAVIPAHNESASLATTIESMLRQTATLDRIIVVNDGSNDDTGAIAERYAAQHANVIVVHTGIATGSKAQAQNYVLHMIDTDLFVTVDGDTELASDALGLTQVYFNDARTAAVSGFVTPKKITTFWEYGRFGEYLYGLTVFKPAQNHSGIVLVSSGCFSVYRTDVVKTHGGFGRRTIVEDMDLTWTLQEHGYRTYFCPQAHCYPVEPPTAAIFLTQIERWLRGFMQCVKVRNFNLFPIGVGFGLYVYYNILWSLFSIILVPVTLWFLFRSWGVNHDILMSIGGTVLGEVAFIAFFTIWRGWRIGMTAKAIKSVIPMFLVTSVVNRGMFIYAIWKEWIRGESLHVFKKGH